MRHVITIIITTIIIIINNVYSAANIAKKVPGHLITAEQPQVAAD